MNDFVNTAGRVVPVITGGGSFMTRIISRISRWQDNARQRHALQRLAPSLMKDIGVSEADIWQEAMKPFWRD
jgi:uncharacterized protein YjiS (DUF1127 family)